MGTESERETFTSFVLREECFYHSWQVHLRVSHHSIQWRGLQNPYTADAGRTSKQALNIQDRTLSHNLQTTAPFYHVYNFLCCSKFCALFLRVPKCPQTNSLKPLQNTVIHTQSYRCVLALYTGAVEAEGGNSLLHTLYCEHTLVPPLARLWLGEVLGPKGDGFHHVHRN